MTNLDDTDRELIALLRDDARMSVAALAQRLKVARGTVQNRLARLQRGGIAVLNTGHRHPAVLAAVQAQLDRYTKANDPDAKMP